MFELKIILCMKNGDKISFEEKVNNKDKFITHLLDKISKNNYIIIDENIDCDYLQLNKNIDADCIWIKDTKDIQHVVIKEM